MSDLINKFLKLQATKHNNLFEAAKKLDKVGKENDDIDNDGDVDSSDKYLHNRRKAIKKAMSEANVMDKSYHGSSTVEKDNKPIKGPSDIKSSEGPTAADKKALDKKVNQIQKEEVEEIDEISKELLGKYLHKADPMPLVGKQLPPAPSEKRREGARLARAKLGARPSEFGTAKVKGSGPDAMDRAIAAIHQMGKDFNDPVKRAERQAGVIKHRAEDPGFNKYLSDQGRENPYKKLVKKEEVEFSEEELAHFAAVFEAGPVAPTPNDYTGKKDGPSVRDLSDETMSEEEIVKRGRGRPKGAKSGSKHGEEEKAEPMRVAAQIRNARPSFDGNVEKVSVTHPATGKVHRVPQHAALQFNKDYAAAEKPAHKDAIEAAFIKKHMS